MRRRFSRTPLLCPVLFLVVAASSCMAATSEDRGAAASGSPPFMLKARAASAAPIVRRCPKAAAFRPGPEGAVAYVANGSLHLLTLSSGRDRVLVRNGEAPVVRGPVSFSPDGRWVAFGQGLVVPSAGGPVCSPLGRRGPTRYGSTFSWNWLPNANVLIGQTVHGNLIQAWMGGRHRRLPIRVSSWALDPSGRRIAYAPDLPHAQQVRVFDLAAGSRRIVYRTPPHRTAPPWVAGWSPDGRWALFWPDFQNSASLAADGLPLRAVSVESGRTVTVARIMLAYREFMTSCGRELVVAAGGDRYVTDGKRIVAVAPSSWRPKTLAADRGRSWYEPACSPDGQRIAVVSTRNGEEPRFDVWNRSLWILCPRCRSAEKLLSAPGFSYENPIWSADGRSVLVVRRQSRPRARASLCLASLDRPGRCRRVADVGRVGFGYYGINCYGVDWYQPSA